jgi:arsenate reductase (thioredoxin)
MPTTKVLFMCTGNSARSQMAEGLLRHLAGDRYEVFSAGLEPEDVKPEAVTAMAEIGIDISAQRAKPLSDFLGKVGFDFLITVCDRAAQNCPVFPGAGERLHWPVDDPAAVTSSDDERMAAFRTARDELRVKIEEWLEDPARPA